MKKEMNPDDMEEWLVAQGERLVMVFKRERLKSGKYVLLQDS